MDIWAGACARLSGIAASVMLLVFIIFGSVAAFNEKFDVANDPEEVIIDFQESRVVDMSGIEALNVLTERYEKVGKTIHLKHLSPY